MKITFIGAGSTIFAINVLRGLLLSEKLNNFEIALLDIDASRLEVSYNYLTVLKNKYKPSVTINKFLATDPHTRDQLTFDQIKSLCDDLIEAHGDWLPKYN